MRKLCLAAVLLLASFGSKAQVVVIENMRSEVIHVQLKGTCVGSGTACDFGFVLLEIPPGIYPFPTFGSMLSSPNYMASGGLCASPSTGTVKWFHAEIQNVYSVCAGAGIVVGSGLCPSSISSPGPTCFDGVTNSPPCLITYCGKWEQGPDMSNITIKAW